MKDPLLPFLEAQGFVILDGALATELERRGACIDDPLWSAKILLEDPGLIRQVHLDYFLAGADVAISASYQASFAGFARRGIGHGEAARLMRLSVQLACEARDEFWSDPANRTGRLYPLVAASVGPYGAFLADGSEYRGDYGLSQKALAEWHRPRLEVLAGSGADLLACETIPCLPEAGALTGLLQDYPQTAAWLSFSCCDDTHLCHGEPFTDGVVLAAACDQVVAVGLNCTPPSYVEGLLRSAGRLKDKPLIVYPNSGEQWDAARHCWLDGAKPVDFGILAQRWAAAGARLIGGCCRTGPREVKAIREALLGKQHARFSGVR